MRRLYWVATIRTVCLKLGLHGALKWAWIIHRIFFLRRIWSIRRPIGSIRVLLRSCLIVKTILLVHISLQLNLLHLTDFFNQFRSVLIISFIIWSEGEMMIMKAWRLLLFFILANVIGPRCRTVPIQSVCTASILKLLMSANFTLYGSVWATSL